MEQSKLLHQTLLTDIEDINFSHDSELLGNCIRNILYNSNILSPNNSTISLSAKSYDHMNLSICITDQSGEKSHLIQQLLDNKKPSKEELGAYHLKPLDLVLDVMKRHNGTFSIDIDDDEVTIFELLIPLKQPELV